MDCLTRRLSVRPASGRVEGAVLAWTDFREIGAFSNARPPPNSSLPPRVNSRHAAPDPNDRNGSTAVESSAPNWRPRDPLHAYAPAFQQVLCGTPRALETRELAGIVEAFWQAARNAVGGSGLR